MNFENTNNFTYGMYHLDPLQFPDAYGDSLHHSTMLASCIRLQRMIGMDVSHLEHLQLFVNYENVVRQFIRGQEHPPLQLVRSPILVNKDGIYPVKLNWWASPDTITRDQMMAFVIGAWIFKRFKSDCRRLFWNLVNSFFRFPNKLRNGTLAKKRFWERDIPGPDTFGLFYRATGYWYLYPFKIIGDLFLPIEAIVSALSYRRTDHVKFMVKVIASIVIEKNFFADVASMIFVNLRRNARGHDDRNPEDYGLGHPVLNVWYHYWRRDSGHTIDVYACTSPLIAWWIYRYDFTVERK